MARKSCGVVPRMPQCTHQADAEPIGDPSCQQECEGGSRGHEQSTEEEEGGGEEELPATA